MSKSERHLGLKDKLLFVMMLTSGMVNRRHPCSSTLFNAQTVLLSDSYSKCQILAIISPNIY